MAPIKIGFIGLSAGGSWASRAHLPYLSKTSSYEITALQNSSEASAKAAAEKYDLKSVSCYGDVTELVADKNVDLVAVSVKVPLHAVPIEAALKAGKDVFVEWPLARNLEEAESLTALAKEKGVKTMVGLQARQDPAIRKAKEYVESGKLGKILGTTMNGTGMIFEPTVPENYLYLLPIENGANLITIPFGHAIDALCYVLGEFTSIQATLANNRPKLTLVDGEGKPLREVEKTAHDYIAVTGTLHNGGGVATVVYRGGMSKTDKNYYWEINGTEGSLVLEGTMGHVQMYHPTLKFVSESEKDGKLEIVDVEKPTGFEYSVGKAYDAFAGIGEGNVTTFEDALIRHRMIDAIYRSHENGRRESYF